MFKVLVSVGFVGLNMFGIVKSEKSKLNRNNEYEVNGEEYEDGEYYNGYNEDGEYYYYNNGYYDDILNDNDEIVGGGFADTGEYKSIVSLGGCGGTILSRRWILTAAHCKGLGTRITVTAGEYNKNTNEGNEQRIVGTLYVHPSYVKTTQGNDIALIKLDSDLTFGRYVQRVRLGDTSIDKHSAGDQLVAVGWGTTSSGGSASAVLKEVELPFVTDDVCKNAYAAYGFVTDHMYCAGKEGVDACQGDSGGPLYLRKADNQWVQVGVTSWGVGCAKAGYPGVWTEISHFLNWISTTSGISIADLTAPVLFNTDWTCVPGIPVPLRAYNSDVECMSNNNRDCLWSSSDAGCLNTLTAYGHSKDSTSLSCGSEHQTQYGATGYGNAAHWCEKGKNYFTDNNQWRCVTGISTPLRFIKGDIECMSHDNRNCRWYNCANSIIAYKHTLDATSLSCGAEHAGAYGSTGYSDTNHWCSKAREHFADDNDN